MPVVEFSGLRQILKGILGFSILHRVQKLEGHSQLDELFAGLSTVQEGSSAPAAIHRKSGSSLICFLSKIALLVWASNWSWIILWSIIVRSSLTWHPWFLHVHQQPHNTILNKRRKWAVWRLVYASFVFFWRAITKCLMMPLSQHYKVNYIPEVAGLF